MRAVLIVFLLAALAVGVAYDGGFDAVPQWAFAATAAAAAVIAVVCDRSRAFALLRAPPVLVLLAIAVLQAASAAWTIGAPSEALRAGAVTAGYAALALGSAVFGQSWERIAAAIAVAAGLTAFAGLTAAALHSSSFAERIEGAWRPEGPFGYPPALALVQVCALPALLAAMARARPVFAALAAAGAASAAGVLVLSVNRLSLGLAVLVLGIALAAPERTVGARRPVVFGAVLLFLLAGLAFHELLGSWTPRHTDAGAARGMALLAIVAAAPAAWLLACKKLRNSLVLGNWGWISARRAVPVGAAILAISVVAGLFSASALSARRFDAHQSFTHGRTWMWSAASHAAADRPLQGYGAGSFLPATIVYQPGQGRLTRFAHNLPLELAVELGIAGFLLAVALYAAAGRALWRARGSPALWLLGPAVAAFLLSNLLDWPWHLAGTGAVFAVALGGLLSRPPNPA